MTKSKFLVGDFFGGGGVVASEDLRNKAEKASNQDAFLASRSFEDRVWRGIAFKM